MDRHHTPLKYLGRLAIAIALCATSLTTGSPVGAISGFSVTPSTGLVDNQTITVTGLSDEGGVGICPTSSAGFDNCQSIFPSAEPTSGRWTYQVMARIIVTSGNGTSILVDCRTTSCSLRAWSYDDTTDDAIVVGDVPLGFVPDAPLRPAPTLSVSPSEGLVDGQEVTVTASVSPSDGRFGVPVFQCTEPVSIAPDLIDVFRKCDVNRSSFLDAQSSGSVQGTVTVSPIVQTSNGPFDCRAAGSRCVLAAFDGVYQDASTPLAFDATAPIKPALLQRYDPSALEDTSGTPTTYDLVGFTPNDPYTVKWCNSGGVCLPGIVTSGVLDHAGWASFQFADDSPDIPGSDTTCVDACMLTAIDAHGLTAQGGPSFAVGTPVEPPETPFVSDRLPVTITPNKGLHDGQVVTVTASGFTPGANVSLIQCTGTALAQGIGGCDLDTSTFLEGTTITADAQGRVSATFTIRRFLEINGNRVDCASGNIDPDAWTAGIAQDPARETSLQDQGYFSCLVGVADLSNYRHSGGAPIAFDGAVFKPLPWESQAPRDSGRAPGAATAVRAQPTYAG